MALPGVSVGGGDSKTRTETTTNTRTDIRKKSTAYNLQGQKGGLSLIGSGRITITDQGAVSAALKFADKASSRAISAVRASKNQDEQSPANLLIFAGAGIAALIIVVMIARR